MADRDRDVRATPELGDVAEAGSQASPSMLTEAAQQVGAAALQRKIQRRAIQRRANGAGGGAASASASASVDKSAGSALPGGTRDQMERSFGTDFSSVRVHQDRSAADLGALAYTQGSDVHFAPGQYAPGTKTGDALIGHELAHVVQQSAGRVPDSEAQGKDAPIVRDQSLETEADEAGARAARGEPAALPAHASSGAGVQRKEVGAPIQLFESEEHQALGNEATGSAAYNVGGADKFELTHGDIVALSGDVFLSDDLFRLAAIPGNKGQKTGTRDEVLWALQDETIWEMRAAKAGPYAGKKDARFQSGGPYAGYIFSDAVKDAVRQRYQHLGANNTGHFAAPKGRDASGQPIAGGESAGTNYRGMHETAIRTAYAAGQNGGDAGMGMAREAAAQHFLTDAFSAGHLRTPVAEMREYWGHKYPLFWYNLRHKIALDTAIEMTSGTPVTAHYGYTQISESVEAMAGSLPSITLGDLMAIVFHNIDNEKGVSIEGGGKVMGDNNLDDATKNLAIAAIQAGNKDVTRAYELGKQMGKADVKDADLFAQVRTTSGGTADKYAAELQMPRPAAGADSQNWKAVDIGSLWDQKMLGSAGDTVGQVISKQMQGGSINIQLRGLAEKFPESNWGLHPRASYLKGFVDKLVGDPKAGMLDIINWAPHGMWTGDAALESGLDLMKKGAAGDKRENLAGLTLEQRVSYVRELMGDDTVVNQEMVIQIFLAATPASRKELYKRIEGHEWNGDFHRSLGSRDELYKMMGGKRVDALKSAINA